MSQSRPRSLPEHRAEGWSPVPCSPWRQRPIRIWVLTQEPDSGYSLFARSQRRCPCHRLVPASHMWWPCRSLRWPTQHSGLRPIGRTSRPSPARPGRGGERWGGGPPIPAPHLVQKRVSGKPCVAPCSDVIPNVRFLIRVHFKVTVCPAPLPTALPMARPPGRVVLNFFVASPYG